jgi:hypothetical protein
MVDSLRSFPVAPLPSSTPATDTFTRRSQLMGRLAQGEQVDPAESQQLDMDALTSGNEFMTGLRAAGYSLAPAAKAFGGQMLESVAPEYSNQLTQSAKQDMEEMPVSLRPTYQTFAEAKDKGGFGGVMNKIAGAAGEAVPSLAAMGAGYLAGGPLGAVATMVPLEGGETAMELRDDPAAMANTTPLERTGLTLGRGLGSAILENVGPQTILAPALKSALRAGVGAGVKPALQTIGSLAAKDAATEYGTEASQDLLGQAALKVANPARAIDLAQANEAGLAGAVGGAMSGGVAGGIQAAASNREPSGVTTAEQQAQSFQPDFDANAVVSRLRQFSDNPEQVGKQASDSVVSGISKAIATAGNLGELYETLKPRIAPALQTAGEAAASGIERGQELNNAIKDTLGEYVLRNVSDPADQAWALDKINSSSDAELGILKDALRAKDVDSFKQDMAMYLFTTGRSAGKGASNLTAWAKDFGKGAVENLAGKFSTQTPESRKAVYKSILDSFNTPEYDGVYSKIKNMPAADRTTILSMFADAAENGTVAQMRQAESDPEHPLHAFAKAWEADTHHSFSDSMAVAVSNRTSSITEPVRDEVVADFLQSKNLKSSIAPRITAALGVDTHAALTAPQKGMLSKLAAQTGEENGEVLFAKLQRQYNSALDAKAGKSESSLLDKERLEQTLPADSSLISASPLYTSDASYGREASYQDSEGEYRDADGDVMDVEKPHGAFFTPERINEVIADAKFTSKGNSHIPIQLSALDKTGAPIPAAELAKLFTQKYNGVTSAIKKPVIKNGKLVLNISPMSLASMSRSPAYRKASEAHRLEYDSGASVNKNAGNAFSGMFTELLTNGIDIDVGTDSSVEPIHISVDAEKGVLRDDLIIRRVKDQEPYTIRKYKTEKTGKKSGPTLKDMLQYKRLLDSFNGVFVGATNKLDSYYRTISTKLTKIPKNQSRARLDLLRKKAAVVRLRKTISLVNTGKLNEWGKQYTAGFAENVRKRQSEEELRALKNEFFGDNLSLEELDNLVEFYSNAAEYDPNSEVATAARETLEALDLEPITLRPQEQAVALQDAVADWIETQRISNLEVSQKGETSNDEADKAFKNYRSTPVFDLAVEMANADRESTNKDSFYVRSLRRFKQLAAAGDRNRLNKAYRRLQRALKAPERLSNQQKSDYTALLGELKKMAAAMKAADAQVVAEKEAAKKEAEEKEAAEREEAVKKAAKEEADKRAERKKAKETAAEEAELSEAAREKFVAIVKKLVGNRVAVRFDNLMYGSKGIAAGYKSRDDALEEVTNERRKLVRLRKKKASDRPGKESDASLDAAIAELEIQEKEILDDVAILGFIDVAAGRTDMAGLAEHEAFHGAFSFFFSKEERRILTTAFTRGLVARRLREYFKDEPTVLKQLEDPEEAAAYGFQVWMYNPEFLKVGQQTQNLFQRFKTWLMKLVGALTPEEKAEIILRDFRDGVREREGTSPLQRILDKDRPWDERAQKMARDIGKILGNFYDMGLTSTYERMLNMENPMLEKIAKLGYSAVGEAGNEAGMVQRIMSENKRLLNKANRIFKGLSDEQMLALHNAMILDTPAADAEVRARQIKYNAFFREMFDYQKDADVDIGVHTDGGEYYPLVWDAEKVMKNRDAFFRMLEKPEYVAQMKRLMKTPNEIWDGIVSYVDRGDELVNIMGTNSEPVSEASHRRTLGFISREDRREFMTDDPVHTVVRYIKQAVRQTEFVRSYGKGGSELKKLVSDASSKYGASVDEIALTKDYIDGLLGNKEVGMSRELKDLYGALSVYQNYRLLPFSLLSSLVDPMGVAIRSNSMQDAFETFSYSIKNLFKEWKKDYTRDEWEAIAEDWGIIEDAGTTINAQNMFEGVTLRGTTKDLNDKLFKYNLLNGWIRNNTIMAVKAAQRFFYRSATETFGKHGKRHLEELGLSVDDVVYDKKLGRILLSAEELVASGKSEAEAAEIETRLRNATDKFVRQALLNPSSAELPNWASNPYLAPIAHLKNFVWAFNATITKQVLHEMENENYKPVLLATAYVPGMIAADFIKDMVSNAGEEPPYKKDWGVVDYVEHGVKRSGLTGTGQFFVEAKDDMTRGGSGVESFVGPTLGQMQRGVKALASGDDTQMWNWLVKSGPFSVVYDQTFVQQGV